MIYLSLEVAEAADAERFDEDETAAWQPIASSQAPTEELAKAAMLDNVLEALNCEDLNPFNQWVRLTYYGDDHQTIIKVETF